MTSHEQPSMTTSKSHVYIDETWDATIDTTLRRVVYGSFAGGIAALVLFRGASARSAMVAFGAGFGAGSAYQENQDMFDKALKMPSISPSSSKE